ncbi:MAG: hypothetical protein M3R04_10700 [bacterium]|nr:hypothetical protein [bacterium]
MSTYRNIEVNLLPPELMPPPQVRTAVILNAVVILGVLTYMLHSVYSILGTVRSELDQIEEAKAEIKRKQPVVAMYTELTDAREKVDKYGRLVSLASVDYIDAPVLLDRLAKIIPAGVYLARISNDKPGPNTKSTVVQVDLVTTREDPALIQATLDAFKRDGIFRDCYLRGAEMHKESISGQLPNFGIDWTASGPDVPQSIDVKKYEFIVMANVPKMMDTGGLPVISDQSVFLADIEFHTPPPEDEENAKSKAERARKGSKARKPGTKEPEAEAANAPEGVKPVGVN